MMFNPTIRLVAALLSLLVLVQGCAVNPATGQREISFVSEAQEIRMGQQADPAATAQFGGLYPDNDLQAYVTGLGESIAAVSERRASAAPDRAMLRGVAARADRRGRL